MQILQSRNRNLKKNLTLKFFFTKVGTVRAPLSTAHLLFFFLISCSTAAATQEGCYNIFDPHSKISITILNTRGSVSMYLYSKYIEEHSKVAYYNKHFEAECL